MKWIVMTSLLLSSISLELIAEAGPAEPVTELCPSYFDCNVELTENWHLPLLNANSRQGKPLLATLLKSRNFKQATEQLHYSKQKVDDLHTEVKLQQLMLDAIQKFQAEPDALGCRDTLCLLQITVPKTVKPEDVKNSLSAPDLSWRTLRMSSRKTKYHWHLRFVATAEADFLLPKPE
jgi:hypothetical protein